MSDEIIANTIRKIIPILALRLLLPFFVILFCGCPEIYAGAASNKPHNQQSKAVNEKIESLIGPNDSVILADESGKTIIAVNENKMLIPASTLKLLTSLAALHYLGEDFRFKTEFYLDTNRNLIIKGYGDPLLISEEIQEIAKSLSAHVSKYNHLGLDTSYFGAPLLIPGVTTSLQPYDSPNGALCVNFNTVFFQKDKNGKYISAEPQTPLLPYVLPKVKKSGLRRGRILLSSENDECVQYAGHLFQYFFNKNNITSSGDIKTGKANPSTDKLIHTHISRFPLPAVIEQLLEYSNNYMANQLLLTLSANRKSPPGTLDKGVKVLTEFAEKELGIENIQLAEGSGISRKNRITAGDMLKVLNQFAPHYRLLRKEDKVYYKTGHLKGIRTRAGYIENNKGELLPFVIFVNTPNKSSKPILKNLNKLIENMEK